MTDVFISYKRRLRPVVEHLATALRAEGLDVWFDARLEPGGHFSDEISREVRDAKVVLVCWSNDCFAHGGDTQGWVRGEATIGKDRGTLISVQIETTDFDPPWNVMHHENLVGWVTPAGHGPSDDVRWQNVLEAVKRKTGQSAAAPKPQPQTVVQPARRMPWLALGLAAVAIVAVVAVSLPTTTRDSPFKTTMLEYCAETPETLTHQCACVSDVLERELDARSRAIFLIIGKPGASSDPIALARLLTDAGYTKAEIAAANIAIPRASSMAIKECPAAVQPKP